MKRLLIGLFCLYLLNVSCRKTKLLSDGMVFGAFHGECVGEQCIEFFMMTNSKLYEDLKDDYPDIGNVFSGEFKRLPRHKYEQAKMLESKIPSLLYQENSYVFGEPDAHDQGGVYLEIRRNGETRYWYFDNDLSNDSTAYFANLITEINNTVAALQ